MSEKWKVEGGNAETLRNPNERLLRFLSATPEQQEAIDRILEGSAPASPASEAPAPRSPGAPGVGTDAAAAGWGPGAAAEGFITKAELARRLNRDVRTMT